MLIHDELSRHNIQTAFDTLQPYLSSIDSAGQAGHIDPEFVDLALKGGEKLLDVGYIGRQPVHGRVDPSQITQNQGIGFIGHGLIP
jgi:hypothetical protein